MYSRATYPMNPELIPGQLPTNVAPTIEYIVRTDWAADRWITYGAEKLAEAGLTPPFAVSLHSYHHSRIVVEYVNKAGETYWAKIFPPGEYFDSPAKQARFAPELTDVGIPTLDIVGYGSGNNGGFVCYRGKPEEAGSLEERVKRQPDQLGRGYALIGDISRRLDAVPQCNGCGNVYDASNDMMTPASAATFLIRKDTADQDAYEAWLNVHMLSVLSGYGGTGVLYEDEIDSYRVMKCMALTRFSAPWRYQTLTMIHGDLQGKNVLLTDADEMEAASVIDLDNISRLPGCAELTKLLGDDIGPRGMEGLAAFMENYPSARFRDLEDGAAYLATVDLLYDALYLRMIERMEAVTFMLSESRFTGEMPRCAQILDEISMIMSVRDLHRRILQLEQALEAPQWTPEERASLSAHTSACKMEAVKVYVQRRANMVQQLLTGQFDPKSYVPRDDYPYDVPVPMPIQQAAS